MPEMMPEMMLDCDLQAGLEKHHLESYGWARSCCARSTVDAETVLQSAYLKILAGKARYDGRAAFKTWLFAVIRRTAAEERRRQFLSRLWLDRQAAQAPTTFVEKPDEALYRAELQRVFRQALAALPRRQGEVLQLVFYHELSLAEAAEVMGVSLGSARTHYERGKRKLREALQDWQSDDTRGRSELQRIVSASETGR
jgi:RNA polymerase sigma-70 factor (ECF subfamily)